MFRGHVPKSVFVVIPISIKIFGPVFAPLKYLIIRIRWTNVAHILVVLVKVYVYTNLICDFEFTNKKIFNVLLLLLLLFGLFRFVLFCFVFLMQNSKMPHYMLKCAGTEWKVQPLQLYSFEMKFPPWICSYRPPSSILLHITVNRKWRATILGEYHVLTTWLVSICLYICAVFRKFWDRESANEW